MAHFASVFRSWVPALLLVASAACETTIYQVGPGGGGGDDVSPAPDGGDVAPPPPSDCTLPADPFAPAVLKAGVGYLASDALGGRGPNTMGDFASRSYIADAFRCAGLSSGGDDDGYVQKFVAPDGTSTANLVGYLPGSDPSLASEIVLVSSHHDHLGTKGGEVYNGANDNASGTIALIAQAQALAKLHPKRTIAFVAFGYEEHDGNCEGSEYFAAHPPAALPAGNIKYMVDMDMVGTYPLAGELTVYGAASGSRGRTILNGLEPSYADLDFSFDGNADEDSSDFQAFADRGVPYVYFETWDEQCYHKPCDDIDRVDYASMSRVAQLAKDLIEGLAN